MDDLDLDTENILYLDQKISPRHSRIAKLNGFFSEHDDQVFQDAFQKYRENHQNPLNESRILFKRHKKVNCIEKDRSM
jgi:hypothetical protein